jgi:hypothetical protein
MLGIGLGELVLVILLFCFAAWLIRRFATEPYRTYGLWALAFFGLIYILERLHIIALLDRVQI